mmetsp:Transcript_55092/g.175252  ORF Transcript_55092/g.175252 Transcript_55092/m.175252 type:complete len:369 (-) Transcript_55092:2392-3498(-)
MGSSRLDTSRPELRPRSCAPSAPAPRGWPAAPALERVSATTGDAWADPSRAPGPWGLKGVARTTASTPARDANPGTAESSDAGRVKAAPKPGARRPPGRKRGEAAVASLRDALSCRLAPATSRPGSPGTRPTSAAAASPSAPRATPPRMAVAPTTVALTPSPSKSGMKFPGIEDAAPMRSSADASADTVPALRRSPPARISSAPATAASCVLPSTSSGTATAESIVLALRWSPVGVRRDMAAADCAVPSRAARWRIRPRSPLAPSRRRRAVASPSCELIKASMASHACCVPSESPASSMAWALDVPSSTNASSSAASLNVGVVTVTTDSARCTATASSPSLARQNTVTACPCSARPAGRMAVVSFMGV